MSKTAPLRVYIAGPMRDLPRWNFPAFDAAAAYLRGRGFDVVNPAEMDREEYGDAIEFALELSPGFIADALARDIAALATCDAIFLLAGWQGSRGTAVELSYARAAGLRVIYSTPASMPTLAPEPESILDTAKSLTRGDRNTDYGHPLDDFDRTAAMWSTILGGTVTAEQAILCMAALKISRLCHDETKRDSWVDLAGYADCGERVVSERQRRSESA